MLVVDQAEALNSVEDSIRSIKSELLLALEASMPSSGLFTDGEHVWWMRYLELEDALKQLKRERSSLVESLGFSSCEEALARL